MLSKLFNQFRSISTSTTRSSLLRSGFKAAFGKYLFVTNTVTSGVLMGIGDLIQQEIEYQKRIIPERYDFKRLGKNPLITFDKIEFLIQLFQRECFMLA